MEDVKVRNIYTERLDLRIPTMSEQKRLCEILCIEEVNRYYFPTPDRIFNKHNLSKDSVEDLKKAREIFISQLSDWERQKPFYEDKVKKIQEGVDSQKFTWSIFLKDSDTVIGQITCQPKDGNPPYIRDMGWYIDSSYQHNGYCTEAGYAMLDYMFNEVGIEKIITGCADINESSWKILEKFGFEFIGERPFEYLEGDRFLNLREYYCTKELLKKKVR